jgi:hypothetical protein
MTAAAFSLIIVAYTGGVAPPVFQVDPSYTTAQACINAGNASLGLAAKIANGINPGVNAFFTCQPH